MKKKLIPVILLVAISFAISSVFSTTKSVSPIKSGIDYTGVACEQVIRVDGTVEDLGCNHNLVTNYGLEMIKTALNGTAGNWNLTNLTVGGNTSAMAATDVTLANVFTNYGLSPAAATYARIGTGNSSLNYQWTAATQASTVNSTGIYNLTNTLTTQLFAEAPFTSTTLQVGDKLNVTYYWWIA